jgi:hypothetical protein
MAQSIEHVLDSTGREILSVTADDQQRGVSISVIGIWYSLAELTQLSDALARASAYLISQGVTE